MNGRCSNKANNSSHRDVDVLFMVAVYISTIANQNDDKTTNATFLMSYNGRSVATIGVSSLYIA